jgi:putative tryptophan/tyrosine transport system substrate-binding protein
MKRRDFIAGLGSAAAWPAVARAQQPGDRLRRVGVVMRGGENDPDGRSDLAAFAQSLAGLGWIEGRNLRIDVRWPGGDINQIREVARELVGLQPDVIVANGTPVVVALQQETRTIPIVFVGLFDAVASGIVARLDRPSGNITGFVSYEASLGGKWLELLSEIAPGLKRAAILFNPDLAPVSAYMPSLETAARSLKVNSIITPVRSDAEIERAIRDVGSEPGGGLVVMPDVFVIAHHMRIILAAAQNNVPAVYANYVFAKTGGLLHYGPLTDFRHPANYVDRILRGAKPDDLPVQFPTKFEMAVNLKTAKALGLTVPQSILLTADEVIE